MNRPDDALRSAPPLTVKLARHYHWARTEGLRRLIEEDQLNPVERARTATSKALWRRRNHVAPGETVPIYVVGLQRSGTNMLVRGLEQAPEVEVHNENDRRAFRGFLLRDDATVRRIISTSRHRFVLFKPLCDSHRTPDLLQFSGARSRAIWIYRDVDERVRSSVSKFGASNRDALAAIAAGRGAASWQAGGLTEADLALLRDLDPASMDAESASALFWYLRNTVFFGLGLDTHPQVTLVSYAEVVAAPEPAMVALCARLGMDYRPSFVAHIAPTAGAGRPALALDPRVRQLCDDLRERLDRAHAQNGASR